MLRGKKINHRVQRDRIEGHGDLCVTPYIPDSYRDSVVKKINNKKALDENMWNFFESVAR